MLGEVEHKLESRLAEEIWISSDIQMTPSLWQKVKKNSRASYESGRGECEKVGLELNIQEIKIMAFGPTTSWLYIRVEWGREASKPGVSSLSLAQPCLAVLSGAVLVQFSLASVFVH